MRSVAWLVSIAVVVTVLLLMNTCLRSSSSPSRVATQSSCGPLLLTLAVAAVALLGTLGCLCCFISDKSSDESTEEPTLGSNLLTLTGARYAPTFVVYPARADEDTPSSPAASSAADPSGSASNPVPGPVPNPIPDPIPKTLLGRKIEDLIKRIGDPCSGAAMGKLLQYVRERSLECSDNARQVARQLNRKMFHWNSLRNALLGDNAEFLDLPVNFVRLPLPGALPMTPKELDAAIQELRVEVGEAWNGLKERYPWANKEKGILPSVESSDYKEWFQQCRQTVIPLYEKGRKLTEKAREWLSYLTTYGSGILVNKEKNSRYYAFYLDQALKAARGTQQEVNAYIERKYEHDCEDRNKMRIAMRQGLVGGTLLFVRLFGDSEDSKDNIGYLEVDIRSEQKDGVRKPTRIYLRLIPVEPALLPTDVDQGMDSLVGIQKSILRSEICPSRLLRNDLPEDSYVKRFPYLEWTPTFYLLRDGERVGQERLDECLQKNQVVHPWTLDRAISADWEGYDHLYPEPLPGYTPKSQIFNQLINQYFDVLKHILKPRERIRGTIAEENQIVVNSAEPDYKSIVWVTPMRLYALVARLELDEGLTEENFLRGLVSDPELFITYWLYKATSIISGESLADSCKLEGWAAPKDSYSVSHDQLYRRGYPEVQYQAAKTEAKAALSGASSIR